MAPIYATISKTDLQTNKTSEASLLKSTSSSSSSSSARGDETTTTTENRNELLNITTASAFNDPFNNTSESIGGGLGAACCISPSDGEYLNKSYDHDQDEAAAEANNDDDDDDDDDDDNIEYNFVDDFTDLSKELDDNWIQEDELWYNNLTPAMKQAAAGNPFLPPSVAAQSIHPPRILHRIDEESGEGESEPDEEDEEEEDEDDEEEQNDVDYHFSDDNKLEYVNFLI